MTSPVKFTLLFSAFVVFVVFSFTLISSEDTAKRNRYLIPEGYKGWLCLTYSVPGAPILKLEDGFRLVEFSKSGVVETFTKGMPGKYKDEFLFYSSNKRREINYEKEMGGGYTVSQNKNSTQYTFKFWVSPNAKEEQPTSNKCGKFHENDT